MISSPYLDNRGMFEDIPQENLCLDRSHNPPTHVCIPHGKRLVHICPSCGKKQTVSPIQVSL